MGARYGLGSPRGRAWGVGALRAVWAVSFGWGRWEGNRGGVACVGGWNWPGGGVGMGWDGRGREGGLGRVYL